MVSMVFIHFFGWLVQSLCLQDYFLASETQFKSHQFVTMIQWTKLVKLRHDFMYLKLFRFANSNKTKKPCLISIRAFVNPRKVLLKHITQFVLNARKMATLRYEERKWVIWRTKMRIWTIVIVITLFYWRCCVCILTRFSKKEEEQQINN